MERLAHRMYLVKKPPIDVGEDLPVGLAQTTVRDRGRRLDENVENSLALN